MGRTKALYAGSFDPPTWAHLDIMEQADSLFDTTVVIGVNAAKNGMLHRSEREQLFKSIGFDDIDLPPEGESIVDTAKRLNAKIIIRGIRGIEDVGPEQAYFDFIEIASQNTLNVVYFMSPPQLRTTSSSLVRSVMALNGWEKKGLLHNYCPEIVIEALSKRRKPA